MRTLVAGRLVSIALAASLVATTMRPAFADAPTPELPSTGPEEILGQKIAVWRFDALGIQPEVVDRLETLFRMELDRLDKAPMPSRRDIERAITADQRDCTGEEKCLAAIGKKLGVEVVVTGTVGSLGDTYVLNIKAVDVATAKQLQRIQSDPLKGSPDEMIETVRVAAYKLLAPAQIHGAIQVQTDLVGASVSLDGKAIGKTPLANLGVIGKLGLGKHHLRVDAQGYSPFEDDVDVHFQKVSQVVVRLLPSTEIIGTGKITTIEKKPFYTRTWFLVGVGAVAVLVGAAIGAHYGKVRCYDGLSTSHAEVPCP